MKKQWMFLILFILLPVLSFAQKPAWNITEWIRVNDTTHVNKEFGRGYFFTQDSAYYLGMGSYLARVTNQASGTFSGGTVTGATNFNHGVFFKDTVGFANGLKTDWIKPYTSSRDTIGFHANPVFYPLGNALSLDGSTQYAKRPSSDDTLNMGEDDFGLCLYFSAPATQPYGDYANLISKRNGSDPSYLLSQYLQNGRIRFRLSDGTNTINTYSSSIVFDSTYHSVFALADRSGYSYIFIDGKYDASNNISSVGDISNSSAFYLANIAYVNHPTKANIANTLVFNFGKDGLYVTGTGGSDLEIRVGDSSGDILYSEVSPYSPSNPGGLIPAFYRNPGADLNELGYGGLENAERSEKVSNTDFEVDMSGWAEFSTSTMVRHTSSPIDGVADLRTTFDGNGFHGAVNTDVNFESGEYYSITFTSRMSTDTSGNYFIYATNESSGNPINGEIIADSYTNSYSNTTNQTYTVFYKPNNNYVKLVFAPIYNTGGSRYFYLDDVSVKRIGEVAHWKMNESGIPATLADETDNNLDLTTVGSPEMVNADYQTLALKRIWADTVEADSVTARRMYTNRIGLPFLPNDAVPTSGDTIPGLYSYGGEVYAHDASGNNTVISPHIGNDWVLNSFNVNTGIRTYINMFDAIKVLQKLSGVKLIYKDSIYKEIPKEKAVKLVTRMVNVDSLINTWDAFKYVNGKKVLKKHVRYDSTTNAYYYILKKPMQFEKLRRGVVLRNGKYYRIRMNRVMKRPKEYVKPDLSKIPKIGSK